MNLKRLMSRCLLGLVLINWVLFRAPNIHAVEENQLKAQLTAAFIYQITKFTLWPESFFSINNPTFSICVLGQAEPQLYQYLSELENKSTQGYSIVVRQLTDKQYLLERPENNCEVLYATDEEWENLSKQQIIQLTQTTLLIGTSKRFLERGGMLALIIIDSKMKIFINALNIENTPIKLESRLKALAKTI